VAFKEDTAIDKNIVMTDVDIQNILRTKAAVYASCNVLLKTFGYKFGDLCNVFIAGSFGNYLTPRKRLRLDYFLTYPLIRSNSLAMEPLAEREWYCSRGPARQAAEIVENMTHIELSVSSMFFKEFTSALFIPHTELDQFPHIATRVYT